MFVDDGNGAVFLGGYALYRQWRIGDKAEISHSLSYISLIIVGIGSGAYHASLKYPLQLGMKARIISIKEIEWETNWSSKSTICLCSLAQE